MRVKDKVNMSFDELVENGAITIVVFGDSVTHGAVGAGEVDFESVYHNRLKKKIENVGGYVPVNVINSGIGGLSALTSLKRIESQALKYEPDLIIICFGLNDVNDDFEKFKEALSITFEKCTAACEEVIYMTPNMLNTYVAEGTEEQFFEYAHKTAEMQNGGKMDMYMDAAIAIAKEKGVKVCDCYGMWKEMSKTQDTTALLANGINHPKREMHELFANSLFDMIFDGEVKEVLNTETTMYRNK